MKKEKEKWMSKGKEKGRVRGGLTLKATRPTMMPAAKKMKAWMSQITPHTEYT